MLLKNANTADDFRKYIDQEFVLKNPVMDFVLLPGNNEEGEKIKIAYDRMVNSIFRTRNEDTNINRQRS